MSDDVCGHCGTQLDEYGNCPVRFGPGDGQWREDEEQEEEKD